MIYGENALTTRTHLQAAGMQQSAHYLPAKIMPIWAAFLEAFETLGQETSALCSYTSEGVAEAGDIVMLFSNESEALTHRRQADLREWGHHVGQLFRWGIDENNRPNLRQVS